LRLLDATNRTIGVVMRALRFEFHPEQVRVSAEEILADLRYPVRREREGDGRKRVRKTRVRR
jgi:hypothetical protein